MSGSGGAAIEVRYKFGLRCEVFGSHFYSDGLEYKEVRLNDFPRLSDEG